MSSGNFLVTGGAGFIGGNLVKFLLQNNHHVTVIDNFSVTNNIQNIESDKLKIIKGDLNNADNLKKLPTNFDTIFHLSADPEVRLFLTNPNSIYYNNVLATFNLLEWFKTTTSTKLVFTSTSAVYGDALTFPTPEESICTPISLYAGSKLACESLISSYSHTYNKTGIVIRLANVVGPSSTHGILFDMLKKLRENKNQLEIFGDGNQNKSYLYVDDCISGIDIITKNSNSNFHVYNLGSDSQINVNRIIDVILEECGIKNIEKIFTGGIDGGRGWVGDVKKMLLDAEKVKKLGWTPRLNSEEAIRESCKQMIDLNPLN